MKVIDLSFQLTGADIPTDHSYSLYAALSRIMDDGHRTNSFGIHPIRGAASGKGKLRLTNRSRLTIRTPVDSIGTFLPLSGQILDIDGCRLQVGVPQVLSLKPTAALRARIVTIRGFMEPEGFLAAVRRQLDKLGISPKVQLSIPIRSRNKEPKRRVVRIKKQVIVGFALQVDGLMAEESLDLQENGIGGRRHMGCGLFVPLR